MTAPREIPVGLLGFGNVGTGVLRILETHAEAIASRLGAQVAVRRVAVRDPSKPRDVDLPEGARLCTAEELLADPEIAIVVEVMGGLEPARTHVLKALEAGKHVVTANKSLLATHGDEIFALASKQGLDVFYEAAVGGGIPVIRTLREALASDRVQAVCGIVNGTTNFILSEIAATGRAFETVLAEAQARGYAEADPTMDVDGHDAAQKLSLLAAIAFGIRVAPGEVHVEGIRELTPVDLAAAAEFGYVVKLLAIGRRHDDGAVELRVHPTLIPEASLLANVGGAFNAVLVTSDSLGPSLLYGQGAGSLPTGSAVVADVIDSARSVLLGTTGRIPHRATRDAFIQDLRPRPMGEIACAHYLRFTVRDEPGVLGRIASMLGDYDISIASLVQKERPAQGGDPVAVVVMTHEALEASVAGAVETIDRLPFVQAPTRHLRIETEPPVIA